MPRIEIDGQEIEVAAGTTLMEAAQQLGIYIPFFCYHPKLSVAANCRMCLVDVEKQAKPLPVDLDSWHQATLRAVSAPTRQVLCRT